MRYLIVLFAVIGSVFILPQVFPSLGAVAFVVSGMTITWLMLAACGVLVVGVKVTK